MLTEAQKAERARVVGGSDVAALFNIEPWGCRRRLFYQKTLASPDFPEETDNKMMERGSMMEYIVAKAYSKVTGQKLHNRNKMAIHKKKPYCGVHIDRHIVAFDDSEVPFCVGPGVFEAKVANQFVFKQYLENGLPDGYTLQLQWGMHILGWKWGAFGILCPDTGPYLFQLEAFPIEYSPKIGDKIEAESDIFWGQVLNGPIPDQLEDPRDKRCKDCQWHVTCKGTINRQEMEEEAVDAEEAPEMDKAVKIWLKAAEIAKESKDNLEDQKEIIRELLLGREAVISNGHLITNKEGKIPLRLNETGVKSNSQKIVSILDDVREIAEVEEMKAILAFIEEAMPLLDLSKFKIKCEPSRSLRKKKIKG